MILLAILLALFATRQSVVPEYLKQLRWGHWYLAFFEQLPLAERVQAAVCYAIFVITIMFVCWFVGTYQTEWLYDAADLVIGTIFLVSVIGDCQLERDMQPFLKRWQAQEWQSAYVHGKKIFNYTRAVGPSDLLSQTITLYLLRINQVLFAPVFWAVIFGSAGLAMYILTYIAGQSTDGGKSSASDAGSWRKIAMDFSQVLESVPARIVAISIGLLCVNWKALVVAFRRFRVTDREAEIVLKLAVKSALNFNELSEGLELLAAEGSNRFQAIQKLKNNVLLFWVIFVAVLSLFGLAL